MRARQKAKPGRSTYEVFDQIDGTHSWQKEVPESAVLYHSRILPESKVLYFNFALAKEMGLLAKNHPQVLNSALEQKIIETFSLQIINEYDLKTGQKFDASTVKPNPFMATRYLQLQHKDKQGRTSGDGRSIWNGQFAGPNKIWDISSRGTGVTRLAPGSAMATRPLKTGAGNYGYGCGQADISELYGSLILSEIFHHQGIHTERTLAIVQIGKGLGIGVRAAPNLLRPAHLFLYLKQQKRESLKRAVQYFLQRQVQNGKWTLPKRNSLRAALGRISKDFAKFAAMLEREYIFAWMDWDGDNVLADAGIIDYGSIRRFGLRHDQYRYDDVDRWSTNLNEQKIKARDTVQIFAQLFDYLETGSRKRMEQFRNHWSVRKFWLEYDRAILEVTLSQTGFNEAQIRQILRDRPRLAHKFLRQVEWLEKIKVRRGPEKVPDGVNWPAAYNVKRGLLALATEIHAEPALIRKTLSALRSEWFFQQIIASSCRREDRELRDNVKQVISQFLLSYRRLMLFVFASLQKDISSDLEEFHSRCQYWNGSGRLTGNGSEFVVAEVMKAIKQGDARDVQLAIDLFISHQTRTGGAPLVSLSSAAGKLYQKLITAAEGAEEDI